MLVAVDGGVAFVTSLRERRLKNRWRRTGGWLCTGRRWLRWPLPPQGAPIRRVSYHAEAIGDADAVLEWAARAAEQAAGAGAHREAAAQYARVLRFSAGLTARDTWSFLERRAYECFLTNGSDEAIERCNGRSRCVGEWTIRCGWVVCCVRWRTRFTRPVVTPDGGAGPGGSGVAGAAGGDARTCSGRRHPRAVMDGATTSNTRWRGGTGPPSSPRDSAISGRSCTRLTAWDGIARRRLAGG